MKKLLILSFALMLIMSAGVFATETRVSTMGDNNMILLDEENIWLFPSRIMDYPNIAVAEFVDEDYYYEKQPGYYGHHFWQLGMHWKFGQDNPWIVGTYFSQLPTFYPTDACGDRMRYLNISENNRINLFVGRQLGANHNFGMAITRIQSSRSEEMDDVENKVGFAYHELALGLTPTTGLWDVALMIGIGNWTEERADTAITEPDGYMDIALGGRYFYQVNPDYTIVPHAGFMYQNRGIKSEYAPYEDDEDYNYTTKAMGLEIGAGLNWTPATNVLGVMDFGIQYYSCKWENSVADANEDDADTVSYTHLRAHET